MINGKICPGCRVDKPLEDFHRWSASPDGREYFCKPCRKIRIDAFKERERQIAEAQLARSIVLPKGFASVPASLATALAYVMDQIGEMKLRD